MFELLDLEANAALSLYLNGRTSASSLASSLDTTLKAARVDCTIFISFMENSFVPETTGKASAFRGGE